MPRIAKELSAVAIRGIRQPGVHAVGGVAGLQLRVKPTGAKSWIIRVVVGGKRRDIGLGGFPSVSLAEAREAAKIVRGKIANGIDPLVEKRDAKRALRERTGSSMTFEDAARRWYKTKEHAYSNEKHARQVMTTLETYAFPHIGHLTIGEVDIDDVEGLLRPIWFEKNETASRVRQRLEAVFTWAIAKGFRKQANPAAWKGALSALFPKAGQVHRPRHQPSLAYGDVPALMASLRKSGSVSSLALQFVILCGVRSGEARGASWSEIDLEKAVWTIQSERTKSRRTHEVPLPPALLEFLDELPRYSNCDLLFPSRRGTPLSDAAIAKPLKLRNPDVTVHGFRSSIRDWCADDGQDAEIAEQVLGHQIVGKAQAAYLRTNMLERRRVLMGRWTDHCFSKLPSIKSACAD
jgi:integrase